MHHSQNIRGNANQWPKKFLWISKPKLVKMTSCGARWCGDIISTLRNIDFNTKSISELYQLIKQLNVSQNEEPERCSLQEFYIDDFSPKIIVSTTCTMFQKL